MRGKIVYLCETHGQIEPLDTRDKLYFNPNSLIESQWKDLRIGMIMDFTTASNCVSNQASYVRRAPLKWFDGYIDNISTTPWGEHQWNIKTNHGSRSFWFVKENIQRIGADEEINVGDIVKFQCEGYNEKRNRAYNVTKQQLGYITSYDQNNGKGIINYAIPFVADKICNLEQYCMDTNKFFYFVAYTVSNAGPQEITILDEVAEIVFDDCLQYIDGFVEKIDSTKNEEEYIILSPTNGSPCTIKTSFDKFDVACMRQWLELDQHISYVLDENEKATDITWTGYITRFPINPISNDMSAQINDKIWKNEIEDHDPKLVYCRKYKIVNAHCDESQKHFWLESRVFNNTIHIPIKTYKSFQRYKVRYALTDDKVNTKKAIKILVIGVAKAPEPILCEPSQEIGTEQNIVINNYYAPVYQQFNFIQNVLQMDSKGFADYLQNYFDHKIAALSPSNTETVQLLSDAISNDLLLSPVADASLFEEQYIKALRALSKKYNLPVSTLSIEWLSEKCKVYLKTAIIVDYKLMGDICLLSDLSAQSVFYGKFLEQLLKDVLYPLFKNHTTLSDKLTRLSPDGIKEVTSSKQTTIGTYCNAINRNVELISEVCGNCFSMKTAQEWETYWRTLNSLLNEAKEIRNKTDHADLPICIEDVDKMRSLIIAPAGIITTIEILVNYISNDNHPKNEVHSPNGPESDYLMFTYEKTLYGRNQNIQGLLGKVLDKPALLHISKMCKAYVGQQEIEHFIEKVQNQPFSVKFFKETDKGVEVTLLGVTPDFDTLIQ